MAVSGHWRNRYGFILAATGFAVGLGNIWRFPYLTGENGGGAFVVVYIACALFIAVPILVAEIVIGRQGGGSPPVAMAVLAREHGKSAAWKGAGFLNLSAATLICFLYSVIIGWVLAYLWKSMTTGFAGFGAVAADAEFAFLLASPWRLLGWSTLALGISLGVLVFGVQQGIERAARILMPSLLVLLIGLVLYNVVAGGGVDQAIDYLFTPDFSRINGTVVLAAISQAFFSIGVGMAAMMTFGAYLPREVPVVTSAVIIAVVDTFVAILAGLVIFPMVFANGLNPAGGAGLVFETLAVAFAQMPSGDLVATLFFLLLSFAAITSLVGLLEAQVAWVLDRFGTSRLIAVLSVGGFVFCGSVVGSLAYNHWADVELFGRSLDVVLDFVPNQLFLPIGGLLIAIFAGWMLPYGAAAKAVMTSGAVFNLWRFLIRIVIPPAVAGILIYFIIGG